MLQISRSARVPLCSPAAHVLLSPCQVSDSDFILFGFGAAQAKVAAKKAVKQVKKAAPQVGAARKTVRARAGWWGNVRTDLDVDPHATPQNVACPLAGLWQSPPEFVRHLSVCLAAHRARS